MNGWVLSLGLSPAAKLTLYKLNMIVNLRGCYYPTLQLYQKIISKCISAHCHYRDGLFVCCYDIFIDLFIFTKHFQISREAFVLNVKPDPEIQI